MAKHSNDVTLEVIGFPGTANLPYFVGEDRGFFARAGISVNLTATPSSVFQMTNLAAGEFHIAATAFDNVVAYQEEQGAVALDRDPEFFVFLGGSQIELSLVVAPEIRSFADLKGKTLALDALSTGFAFVLRRMLENSALSSDDYEMVSVGGTAERWKSLEAGEHAGALLTDPFTGFALAAGFHRLESSLDTLAHYEGVVHAARRPWAAENADALRRFIRGYLDSLDWAVAPENREAAAEILVRHMPAMPPAAAAGALAKLASPRTGLAPDAALDAEGMRAVLELRSRYGTPGTALTEPEKYVDLGYYDAVMRAR